ncbi:6570_t:CDS:2, partial [Paraglomus brasilianum]
MSLTSFPEEFCALVCREEQDYCPRQNFVDAGCPEEGFVPALLTYDDTALSTFIQGLGLPLFQQGVVEPLTIRARFDIPDNTGLFLRGLCCPFDEPIRRDNVEECLMAPLLQKLPAHPYYCRDYPDYLEPTNSEPFYNVPRL